MCHFSAHRVQIFGGGRGLPGHLLISVCMRFWYYLNRAPVSDNMLPMQIAGNGTLQVIYKFFEILLYLDRVYAPLYLI